MKFVVKYFKNLFSPIFQKRSIIIISEKRTNHVSLSGWIQFATVTMMISCVVWASYTTGRYMSAQSVLEERDQTIKSVANSRIDTNFNYTIAQMPTGQLAEPSLPSVDKLTDPTYTLSAVNHDKLYARIALLEDRVRELKSTNSEIIQTVREKTYNKISGMEAIIRNTGLNVDRLKREAAQKLEKTRERAETVVEDKNGLSQGGPFIPAGSSLDTEAERFSEELDVRMDEVTVLQGLLSQLPLAKPIAGASYHSNFGRRVDPFTRRPAFHAGVDMSGPSGTKVLATGDGKVVYAGWRGAYGNTVDIDHGHGITTRFGHMSKVSVSVGQKVTRNEIIGVQGSTGRSTGAHLHYEVRLNNRPTNPASFLKAGKNVSQAQ